GSLLNKGRQFTQEDNIYTLPHQAVRPGARSETCGQSESACVLKQVTRCRRPPPPPYGPHRGWSRSLERPTQQVRFSAQVVINPAIVSGTQPADQPPSTGTMAPLMKDAASEARKTAASANCSGIAQRSCSEIIGLSRVSPFSSKLPAWVTIPVLVGPGRMALQRMPSFA